MLDSAAEDDLAGTRRIAFSVALPLETRTGVGGTQHGDAETRGSSRCGAAIARARRPPAGIGKYPVVLADPEEVHADCFGETRPLRPTLRDRLGVRGRLAIASLCGRDGVSRGLSSM